MVRKQARLVPQFEPRATNNLLSLTLPAAACKVLRPMGEGSADSDQ